MHLRPGFNSLCGTHNNFTRSVNYSQVYSDRCGPGSIVGIANAYGLDGPGIESR